MVFDGYLGGDDMVSLLKKPKKCTCVHKSFNYQGVYTHNMGCPAHDSTTCVVCTAGPAHNTDREEM